MENIIYQNDDSAVWFGQQSGQISLLPTRATKALNRPIACAPDPAIALMNRSTRVAMTRILASPQFSNSPRMCRLLSYLLEKQMAHLQENINQYDIGIDVFNRDPATFDPGDDPIVRVQVGRLRDKLSAYYTSTNDNCDYVISIPVGTYLPAVTCRKSARLDSRIMDKLAIAPLDCLSAIPAFMIFSRGLSDELSYQLFKEFGQDAILHHPAASERDTASHVLEGSIRMEPQRVRASFRMVQTAGNRLLWWEQLDVDASLSISRQEEISSFIKTALRRYFDGANSRH